MAEPVTVKFPNPRTEAELIGAGMSPEGARHKMNEFVFGVGYEKDEQGNPIENGKGSAKQPTSQHVEALRVADERRRAAKPVAVEAVIKAMGETLKGQSGISAELIAQAVAAGVQAGLAAAKEQEL